MERSLPTEEERHLPIVPIRGCLEKVRKMLKGAEYIGRGSSQHSAVAPCATPTRSRYMEGNWQYRIAIRTDQNLREHLPRLSGKRLVCQCYFRIQAAKSGGLRQRQMRTAQFHLQQS